MKFSYSSGQRPLDGFTLKRGIGKGGFGEVYFAISDGGKEVALKLVRGDHQVELRGVAQCLNLKHPNLVALYDLRTDSQGDHWVVMEYVAGEPLSAVIGRHPRGLARELVREWFLGLARAVTYLHDHGIVHRDLKPGNVFIENGGVKVCDYGLSKSISTSQRTAQTQSVGTVHYMAPEISTGNYNKQIDIYAAGVVLYEMVTGRVPFDGESAGEILMKHLTSTPDLSRVPAEWVPIITRALAKNPAHRYASMSEMAKEVEKIGQESPAAAPTVVPPAPLPRPGRGGPLPVGVEPVLSALPAVTSRQQAMELTWSMTVAVGFAALATLLWAAVRQEAYRENDWTRLSTLFFLTVAASWAVLVPGKLWTERRGDSWTRRLVMLGLGGVVGLLACWLDGWSPGQPWRPIGASDSAGRLFSSHVAVEASYFCYYALAFFVLRWWQMTGRRRPQRFSFAPILGAGIWGWVLLLLIRPPHQPWSGMAALVLVLTAAIVQLVSPWEQPPPAPSRRVRLRHA
ncbi:MAG: serine/threonine-protein kinase [Gemmataceae bacterium]